MFEKITITPKLILNKFYGYNNFRKGQLEIIESILSKKDTLAIMPTGGGKSICFQIPAIVFSQSIEKPQLTIVISPLISLMKDQVDTLNNKGIKACYINSSLSKKIQKENFKLISQKKIKILYVSPERLSSKSFISLIQKVDIAMIVVDEAHCISQWGNNFRPEYKNISNFYKYINKSVVKVAFTATANEKVQLDICNTLKLTTPQIYIRSFSRENLNIEIISCESERIKNLILLRILNQHKGETGIIYCATKIATQNVSEFINKYRLISKFFHSKIEKEIKNTIQTEFMEGKIKLIVATNAFGMGIDKSNVRFVIHYQIPGNIENYYQEIGRAGRDNKISNCYCLYLKDDLKIQRSFIKNDSFSFEKDLIKLKQMYSFLESKNCRRNEILKYFGEIKNENCNQCDNCLKAKINNQYKTKYHNNQLLLKISKNEMKIIKRLLQQKIQFTNSSFFLTDAEICFLSILKPKCKDDYYSVPGIGKGWIDKYYKLTDSIMNSNDKISLINKGNYDYKRISGAISGNQ